MERVKQQLLHSTSCICKVQQRPGKANKPNWNHPSAPSLFFLWCHATNCPGALLCSPQGAGLAGAAEGCGLQEQTRSGIRSLPRQAAPFCSCLPPHGASQRADKLVAWKEGRGGNASADISQRSGNRSLKHSPGKFGWTRLCWRNLQPRVRQKVLQWFHWIEVGSGTKQALGWSHLPQTMRVLTFVDWLCDYK